jgi:hypothetical protein
VVGGWVGALVAAGGADTCLERGGHKAVFRHRDAGGIWRTQPWCVGSRPPHEQYDAAAVSP